MRVFCALIYPKRYCRLTRHLNVDLTLAGLKSCYQNEIAFRQEVWLLVLATPCAFLIGSNYSEIIALVTSILLVSIVELLNSAIENILDKTVET